MADNRIRTTCGICQIGCGAIAYVSEGRVTKIEGDPDHPLNRGRLCPKGYASLEYLYHPDRLRTPLKRTGDRGEGKWTAIGWDEALSTIADQFAAAKADGGPESVAFIRGAAKGLQEDYLTRFGNLFGSPNITAMAHVCFVPRRAASLLTYGYFAIPDLEYPPKCIIVWGVNISETLHHVYDRIMKAVRDGACLIVIDPFPSHIAAKANLWIRLKPGSDLALALGMLQVIIRDNLFDADFVEKYTTGFEELKAHVASYTPAVVGKMCWIPPETVEKAARLYAERAPAVIQWGNGIDHSIHNFQTSRAISLLRSITGNLGVPGGELDWQPPPVMSRGSAAFSLHDRISPDVRARRLLGGSTLLPTLFYALPQAVIEAMITSEPYPVKTAFIQGCNPLLTYPDARKVHRALKGLDFLTVTDHFLTPTAALADIVLPVATYLEFDSIVTAPYSLAVTSVQQTVTKIPECRSDYEILAGLARKLGFGESFWESEEACLDYILAPAGITFAEFKHIAVLEGRPQYRPYVQKGFPTPSGKAELVSARLKAGGFDPLPRFEGDLREQDGNFPLLLTSGKNAPFRHSGGRQIASLRKLAKEPLLVIHPKTAADHAIAEGDHVTIETSTGRITQKAMFNKEIDPRVVYADFAWWFPEMGRQCLYAWDQANINIIIGDEPPYGKEMGTPTLRAIPCRIARAG
jgi:anaerobic selenocysteine-containing dehydrogenase